MQHVTALFPMRSSFHFPAVPTLIALNPLATVSTWLFIFHCCGCLTCRDGWREKGSKGKGRATVLSKASLRFTGQTLVLKPGNISWKVPHPTRHYKAAWDLCLEPLTTLWIQNIWLEANLFVKLICGHKLITFTHISTTLEFTSNIYPTSSEVK